MNKLYVSVLALALAGSATAQSGQARTRLLPKSSGLTAAQAAVAQPVAHHSAEVGAERDAFYTEDFSGGGIPTGWTSVDALTPPSGTPVLFQWSNNPAVVTPASGNWAEILTFLAPGASNGFLWANSDRGLSTAPSTNALTRLTTAPIDCGNQPSVLLTMKSTIGVFEIDADTACKIRVSTDNVNWTNFAPFPCLKTGNTAPPCSRFSYNPQDISINISSVAANQSTVYIQFQWRNGWEYYWAMDDLELSPVPDHELAMDFAFTSQFGDSYEYGRMPTSQMPNTIQVGAGLINTGGMEQTNVSVAVSVTDGNNVEVASGTSAINPLILPDSSANFAFDLTPTSGSWALGTYSALFTMTSDQIGTDFNLNNNAKDRYFSVTSDLYSLDAIDVVPEADLSLTSVGTNSFADNTQDVRLLNYYEVPVQTTFYGIEVYLSLQSNSGGYFIAAVYDTADVQLGQAVTAPPMVESDPRVITVGDSINGLVRAAFNQPITLGPGAYYVSANMYQEQGKDVIILDDNTVPQPGMGSLLYTPVDAANSFFTYAGNGNAWAVRLSSNPTVGVQENPSLKGITMYPSPTAGPLEVRAETPGKMTVEVFNTLGAKVLTSSFNGTATTLNLAGNAAGIYTVRIGDGTNFNMQRIVLK